MRLGFFWLLLCAWAAVGAEEVSPPDGVHLVGSAAPITFRWGGTASEYMVEITAGTAVMFSAPVKGHSLTLPLNPGPLYRWKVSPGKAGLYEDPGKFYSFQFAPLPREFNFNGTPGSTGMPGSQAGASGQPGGMGGAGRNVVVDVHREGDFLRVTLEAERSKQQLLLVPGSQPLRISACGGLGGRGGAGAPGIQGSAPYSGYNANPNSNVPRVITVTPPGNGGNGGAGGDGGPGGSVTIRVGPGLDARGLLDVQVGGGPAGTGGAGGPGGAPVPYQPGVVGSSSPGSPGQTGPPGRPGNPGQVR